MYPYIPIYLVCPLACPFMTLHFYIRIHIYVCVSLSLSLSISISLSLSHISSNVRTCPCMPQYFLHCHKSPDRLMCTPTLIYHDTCTNPCMPLYILTYAFVSVCSDTCLLLHHLCSLLAPACAKLSPRLFQELPRETCCRLRVDCYRV